MSSVPRGASTPFEVVMETITTGGLLPPELVPRADLCALRRELLKEVHLAGYRERRPQTSSSISGDFVPSRMIV